MKFTILNYLKDNFSLLCLQRRKLREEISLKKDILETLEEEIEDAERYLEKMSKVDKDILKKQTLRDSLKEEIRTLHQDISEYKNEKNKLNGHKYIIIEREINVRS